MNNIIIKKSQFKNPYLKKKPFRYQLQDDLIYDFYFKL